MHFFFHGDFFFFGGLFPIDFTSFCVSSSFHASRCFFWFSWAPCFLHPVPFLRQSPLSLLRGFWGSVFPFFPTPRVRGFLLSVLSRAVFGRSRSAPFVVEVHGVFFFPGKPSVLGRPEPPFSLFSFQPPRISVILGPPSVRNTFHGLRRFADVSICCIPPPPMRGFLLCTVVPVFFFHF